MSDDHDLDLGDSPFSSPDMESSMASITDERTREPMSQEMARRALEEIFGDLLPDDSE